MRELYLVDEVAALVGEADRRLLAAGAGPTGASTCVTCRAPIGPDEPASVVLVRFGDAVTVAKLAHRTCAASGIIDVPVDALGLTPGQLADLVAGGDSGATARCLLLPHVAGDRPALLVQLHGGLATPATEPGDRVDLVVSGLLERGLHLHPRLGQLPAPAPGWTVTLGPDGPGTARVTEPSGDAMYDGTLTVSRPWLDSIGQLGGRVVLLAGTIPAAGDGGTYGALRVAGRAGTLVAGLVDVRAAGS